MVQSASGPGIVETSYEAFAEAFLANSSDSWLLKHYERPFMTSRLPELGGRSVLDLGCASGFYSRYCLDRGAEVTCVDASATMVEHTVARCEGRVRGHVHDLAEPMAFLDDASIDVIICSLVLHYVRDWDRTLAEFARVLKPSGRCVISTHHPIVEYQRDAGPDYFATRLVEDTWNNFGNPIHVKYYVRPLAATLQSIASCRLSVREVAEPMPAAELREENPQAFEKLSREPRLLFFVLDKPASD